MLGLRYWRLETTHDLIFSTCINFSVFQENFSFLFKISGKMSDYWLISVPGDTKDGQPSWETLKSQVGALSNIWKFHIPADLKVWTFK
jgi:hypothetical protein